MLRKVKFLKIAGMKCREYIKSLKVTRHETPNSFSL